MDDYDEDNFVNSIINEKIRGTQPKKSILPYIEPTNKQVWEDIIEERNQQNDIIKNYEESKKCQIPNIPPSENFFNLILNKQINIRFLLDRSLHC